MKILFVHNRYRLRGGEDESTDMEAQLLRVYGHEVDLWELDNQSIDASNILRTGLETIWSSRSYRALQRMMDHNSYDLVHVQNFFPRFSPAIHHAAKTTGMPVVQSLRNYRLLCLNGFLFRDGRICEDCVGHFVPGPGVIHRCYRGSLGGSAAVASMLVAHRLLRTWTRKVDVFVTPSKFARDKFIEGGLPPEKIVVKPNFVDPDPGIRQGNGRHFLFVGRLSPEKGIDTLLSAWEHLGADIPLRIIGDGPLSEEVGRAADRIPGLVHLGKMPIRDVYAAMSESFCLVFPSNWYETFGRVGMEGFAKGLPVVSANLGSVAELVDDNITGLHFRASDPLDLAEKVRWAWEHPSRMAEMGRNARRKYEQEYTAERNYEMLMDLYRAAIEHAARPHPDRA